MIPIDAEESGLDPHKWPDCPEEFPPILILEEMDKFTITEYKLKALYTILNLVFEMGGQIISTSNLTAKEIQERFPDWFYRRLVESSQDHKIRHRDLHKVVGRTRKANNPKKIGEPELATA